MTVKEQEVLPFPASLFSDLPSLFIYVFIAGIAGVAVRWVNNRYFRPESRGLGRNAPGFLTSVRKAYVENPNPGRQIVEVDHRHLYQSDVPAPSSTSTSTGTSYASAVKSEEKTWEDEWLPEGIQKKKTATGGLPGKKWKGGKK
ncbi:hypothetical protein [Phaffia rhodozyma]|uniref:Uncharacterized protein n=1 Tax=Phaffia rhodozyma TaxID=264483 RepID=A0A0F7SFL3_PHARH|nr:hypothetical protein [Phaffia rhodozyma]